MKVQSARHDETLLTQAAEWLVRQPPSSRPIPDLKRQFEKLTTAQCCAVIGKANALRREGTNAAAK